MVCRYPEITNITNSWNAISQNTPKCLADYGGTFVIVRCFPPLSISPLLFPVLISIP